MCQIDMKDEGSIRHQLCESDTGSGGNNEGGSSIGWHPVRCTVPERQIAFALHRTGLRVPMMGGVKALDVAKFFKANF